MRFPLKVTLLAVVWLAIGTATASAQALTGIVKGGGAPIANSEVTLYSAGTGAPTELAHGRTDDQGAFTLSYRAAPANGVLYVIAMGGTPNAAAGKGPNDAISLFAVLGGAPPRSIVVNEMSTIASVWTSAQFLTAEGLSGTILGLRIAAGNVPNLVDLQTGDLGPVIQDPLNSSQTPALATFNTLANVLSGCITRVQADACKALFAVATPPGGVAPTNTLTAALNIARNPSHQAQALFALLDTFYPVPDGKHWRPVPFIPYLSFAPPAWTLSLVYAGGGLNSLGGIAFDSAGNMWAGDNFLVGAQSTIYSPFGGGVSKLAPNGRALSPMTVGYRGGGVDGPGFGIAIGADERVWVTSLSGKSIAVFDGQTGKPLSPEAGYTFDGQLGEMQGIITTPTGDVWALDNQKNQVVYLPQGDATKGRILGRMVNGKPVDGTLQVKAPFHLAVDQQDRIWVSNSGSKTVTRFPASDPGKATEFNVGLGPHGVAIDGLGNAWIANTVGHPGAMEKFALVWSVVKSKWAKLVHSGTEADETAQQWIDLFELLVKYPGGDVSMIAADGTVSPPFDGGKSFYGPWGIAVDGNDNVWVANAMGRSVVQLCGARPANCPAGTRTGDPLSPPGGYIGGLMIITDVAVDPAGNIWLANNWDRPDEGFKKVPDPALATRFGGNGAVVFFGLAKPVRTPLVGPPRQP